MASEMASEMGCEMSSEMACEMSSEMACEMSSELTCGFPSAIIDGKIKIRLSDKQNRFAIYNQPIFYIAENIKHYLLKKCGKEFNEKKIDSKLNFEDVDFSNINFQFDDYIKSYTTNETYFIYTIDKKNCNISFIYNNHKFTIKSLHDILQKPINLGEWKTLTAYEISFSEKSIAEFENFITTSKNYYDLYRKSLDRDDDHGKFSIFMLEDECGFFNYMGDRVKRSLDTVYLPKSQKNAIVSDLENFLRPETKERYFKLGINYKRTYLLEGIPGSGKTSLIIALASKFNYDVAIVNFGPKFKDSDLMQMMRNLKKRERDEDDRPKFLILEDMDCIFKERKSHDESRNMVTFSGLLNALDGIITPENLICFITTNYKHHLDSALLRPGRIDYIMNFDNATKEQVYDIFNVYMSNPDANITQKFYGELCDLNIKISVSLLQQYLFKYLDLPLASIDNIDELKKMYQSSVTTTDAADTGLFN